MPLWRAVSKPKVLRRDALEARPRRLVDPEILPGANGGALLKVPMPRPRWTSWLIRVPAGATKTFELDAIGLFVWDNCDGRTSVRQIITRLANAYKLNLRAAEVSTIQFLQTLMRKGLIGVETADARR